MVRASISRYGGRKFDYYGISSVVPSTVGNQQSLDFDSHIYAYSRHTANEDAYLRSFYLRFEDASDLKLCLLNFWNFSTNISIWFSNTYRILND